MSDVQFEEPVLRRPPASQTSRGMAGWLVKKGVVRSEAQAQAAMLIAAAAGLVLTGIILLNAGPQEFESDEFPDGYLNDPNYENIYGNES